MWLCSAGSSRFLFRLPCQTPCVGAVTNYPASWPNGLRHALPCKGEVAQLCDLVKTTKECKRHAVSMTKADLIAVIADKFKFPWARAELLVDVVFDCMEQSMSRGEKIEIRATHPNYPLYPVLARSKSRFEMTMDRSLCGGQLPTA